MPSFFHKFRILSLSYKIISLSLSYPPSILSNFFLCRWKSTGRETLSYVYHSIFTKFLPSSIFSAQPNTIECAQNIHPMIFLLKPEGNERTAQKSEYREQLPLDKNVKKHLTFASITTILDWDDITKSDPDENVKGFVKALIPAAPPLKGSSFICWRENKKRPNQVAPPWQRL